jgi:amino acid adenylation domain-containing protein
MSDQLSSPVLPIALEPSASTSGFIRFSREAVEQSIPARFEQQARLYPERIAAADAEGACSYSELNRRANRIAQAILAARGPAPEPVALLIGKGVGVVAAMLGVLKAGKFYVTLDTSQPTPRQARLLAECQPALLLSDRGRLAQAEELGAGCGGLPVLNLDALPAHLADRDPDLPLTADALAYVLYTSGSTGKPKGVMQDHRYVLHLTRVYSNSGRISASDRLALLYSPNFAGAVRDIYCSLLNGATLVFFDVMREGLVGLAAWLRREEITVFFSVATMFRHFCRLLKPEDRFPRVRLVHLGSETVYAGDVLLYQRHFDEASRMIVNLGGSEYSPICQFLVDAGTRITGATVPAGYPTEDVELLLWDSQGHPAATGEIIVRSRYLSRGYRGQPELTAAVFLPDPDGCDRRLFRTGDLGRLLADGCLLHLGRRDFQVKIRGYRVETTEVEAFFTGTGLIRDAAVTAWSDAQGEQNLAAWLVPMDPAAPPTVKQLRDRIAAELPEYLVPASIAFIDALPLTATGKLDYRALPAPRPAEPEDSAYRAPRTAVEQRLQAIWSELLGRERISVHDNFFDLGGHSLAALQVVARIAAGFRVQLTQSCLFDCPTLARLAVAVEQARSIDGDAAIQAVASAAQPLPLSFAQQRLWLFAELEGLNDAFNMVRAFQLDGALDQAALKQALALVASRHANLRTTFRLDGATPVQVIAPAAASVLSVLDLRHLAEGQREAALAAALRKASGRRFNLATGPLWSLQLIRLEGYRQVLHLAVHHLICDDWSIQILLRDLSACYGASLQGQPPALPELPVQYADYAVWQRQWLAGERLQGQLDYWRAHLRGAPAETRLPLDRPRRPGAGFRAEKVRLQLDRELTRRLQQLSRGAETTLYVTLLTAYAILLGRYGNPEEVVLGTVMANRYPVETEALIGFFMSTLALRLPCPEAASFRELQARAHRIAVNGFAHPDVPFDQLVADLQCDPGALTSPLFQALFVLQNIPAQELALTGLRTTPLDLARPSAGATFDLTLSLKETGGILAGALEFNTALFDAGTIETMAAHFQALLAAIAENPELPVAALSW